eukprot:2108889-Rhodomonas_salina.1
MQTLQPHRKSHANTATAPRKASGGCKSQQHTLCSARPVLLADATTTRVGMQKARIDQPESGRNGDTW